MTSNDPQDFIKIYEEQKYGGKRYAISMLEYGEMASIRRVSCSIFNESDPDNFELETGISFDGEPKVYKITHNNHQSSKAGEFLDTDEGVMIGRKIMETLKDLIDNDKVCFSDDAKSVFENYYIEFNNAYEMDKSHGL